MRPSALPRRKRALSRARDCEAGSAILEFAIVLPILVALVAGSVEIGRALFTYLAIERAVQAGARYLAQVPDPTCEPSCSPGAAHAVAMTRGQILANTGLDAAAIRIGPVPTAPAGTVAMGAEVAMPLPLLSSFGLPNRWTITLSHQEPQVAG